MTTHDRDDLPGMYDALLVMRGYAITMFQTGDWRNDPAFRARRRHRRAFEDAATTLQHQSDAIMDWSRAIAAVTCTSDAARRALNCSSSPDAPTDPDLRTAFEDVFRFRRVAYALDAMRTKEIFRCPVCRDPAQTKRRGREDCDPDEMRTWHALNVHVGLKHGRDTADELLGQARRLRKRLCRWKNDSCIGNPALERDVDANLKAAKDAGVLYDVSDDVVAKQRQFWNRSVDVAAARFYKVL